MRQLLIHVPRGQGAAALEIARAHDGVNLARIEATDGDRPLDLVIVHVANSKVEGLLKELQPLPDLHLTLIPRGVITLQPPASEAAQQVVEVEQRSPIEVFLGSLQSVGSWHGFLAYAAAAGAVVWIGLYTNRIYLLIAAMLIAPFAGPAMNVAMATGRGDGRLLWRSLLRYFVGLGVAIGVTAALSLIFRQEVATEQMVQQSVVSSVAVLLPLVAGAAGALNLVQSERSSLVSGAAVGMLVAASLAPPAGLIGMAGAIGRWDMAVNGCFVLLLQLVGINLSGATVFQLAGLTPRGARYDRGRPAVFGTALAVTALSLAGLLFWQFSSSPDLRRSARSQRAAAVIRDVVEASGTARLVEVNVRFTRPDIQGQDTLLGVLYVQRRPSSTQPAERIAAELTDAIQRELLRGFDVTPVIDVTVLVPPPPP